MRLWHMSYARIFRIIPSLMTQNDWRFASRACGLRKQPSGASMARKPPQVFRDAMLLHNPYPVQRMPSHPHAPRGPTMVQSGRPGLSVQWCWPYRHEHG